MSGGNNVIRDIQNIGRVSGSHQEKGIFRNMPFVKNFTTKIVVFFAATWAKVDMFSHFSFPLFTLNFSSKLSRISKNSIRVN